MATVIIDSFLEALCWFYIGVIHSRSMVLVFFGGFYPAAHIGSLIFPRIGYLCRAARGLT